MNKQDLLDELKVAVSLGHIDEKEIREVFECKQCKQVNPIKFLSFILGLGLIIGLVVGFIL